MGALAEFMALEDEGDVVDVSGEGALSIPQLQEVFPTAGETETATAALAAPDAPLADTLQPKPARALDEFLALDQKEQPEEVPGALSTPEGQRAAVQLGLGVGLTATLGPAGLPVRAAANVVIPAGVDFTQRILQGEEPGDAAVSAGITGGLMGAAEVVSGVPGWLVGGFVRGLRGAVRTGKILVRKARGVGPRPELPRIERTSKPFENFLEPGTAEAVSDLTAAGALPPVGQVVEHNLADTMQNIAEASVGPAGQSLRTQKTHAVKTAERLLKDAVEEMPDLTRNQLYGLIDDLTTGRLTRVKGAARGLFRRGDRLMRTSGFRGAPIMVDLRPLKALYKRELAAAEGGGGNALIKKWNDSLQAKDDFVPFADGQRLRSDFFDDAGQKNPERLRILEQSQRVAGRARAFMSRAMKQASKKAPKEARDVLEQAEALWRDEVRGDLTSEVMRKLAKKQPEDMLDALILTGKPASIRMVRDIVMKENPSGEVWRGVQGAFSRRILISASAGNAAFANGEKVITPDGKRFLQLLDSFGKQDDASLNALFPGADKRILDNMRRHANTLHLMQKPAGGQTTGSVWFNMGQAGAVAAGAGAAGAVVATAAGVDIPGTVAVSLGTAGGLFAMFIVPPEIIARVYRNPDMVKWLTVGAKATPGSKLFWKAPIVIAGMMLRNKMLDDKQSEQAVQFINEASQKLADARKAQ